MRRCVIIGGASIGDYGTVSAKLRQDDYMIYCDCGLRHMDGLGAEPDLIVGDFDSYSNHKNVEPKNVITSDSYKNKIDEPLSTIVTPKTNQKTLPNQTKSNQIQFNSFRSKTNNNKKIIQKKSEAKKIPLKSNAKVIENKKNDKEVVSLFPRKLSTSFKPTLLITPTQTDNNTSIVSSNLSRVQNTSVLTEKYQNDIQTIYEKRKNYFDSKSQRNDRRHSTTEIYERSKQY